jgi:hypothetical protein
MHTGIQDRAATAEKRFQKGWNTLRHLTPHPSFISVLITLYDMGHTVILSVSSGKKAVPFNMS